MESRHMAVTRGEVEHHYFGATGQPDPVFESLRQAEFKDVTHRRTSPHRVFRRDRDGITVYVRTDQPRRVPARAQPRYRVVYEGEDDDGSQVQYTILETAERGDVSQLLGLLAEHAHRAHECVLAAWDANPDKRVVLEQCTGFDDPARRQALAYAISCLARKTIKETALLGFALAVTSCVDDSLGVLKHHTLLRDRTPA